MKKKRIIFIGIGVVAVVGVSVALFSPKETDDVVMREVHVVDPRQTLREAQEAVRANDLLTAKKLY